MEGPIWQRNSGPDHLAHKAFDPPDMRQGMVLIDTQYCSNCQAEIPAVARVCSHCLTPVKDKRRVPEP
jgi:predicted amidophosphoribosyltransferase